MYVKNESALELFLWGMGPVDDAAELPEAGCGRRVGGRKPLVRLEENIEGWGMGFHMGSR